MDRNILTARANAYVDFAIEAAKALDLFEDEADLLETIAFWKEFNLIVTCGSDYHGKTKPAIQVGQHHCRLCDLPHIVFRHMEAKHLCLHKPFHGSPNALFLYVPLNLHKVIAFIVYAKCSDAGIKIMSVTDHNCVRANAEAEEAAKARNICYIPGIEIDCTFRDIHFHMLGYGIDYKSNDFMEIERNKSQ